MEKTHARGQDQAKDVNGTKESKDTEVGDLTHRNLQNLSGVGVGKTQKNNYFPNREN